MRTYKSLIFLTSFFLMLSLSTCKNPSGGDGEVDDEPEMLQLTIDINPSQGGSVSPSGGQFEEGKTEMFEASPANGWEFDSWSGDINSTENPYQITINSDMEITANFSERSQPEAFTGIVTVMSDNRERDITFGTREDASVKDGLDGKDVESPPIAPPGSFFTGFKYESMNLYEDYRPLSEQIVWKVRLNRNDGSAINLNWSFPDNLKDGSLKLVDDPDASNSAFELDMLSESTHSVTDSDIQSLFIVYSATQNRDIITNIEDENTGAENTGINQEIVEGEKSSKISKDNDGLD